MYHTNSYIQNQYDDFFILTTTNTDQNIYSNSNKNGFLNSNYGNGICEEFNSIPGNGRNEVNYFKEDSFEDPDNDFKSKIPDAISINISDDCSSVSSIVKTNKKFFNIKKEKEKINLFTNIKHDDKNEMLYEDVYEERNSITSEKNNSSSDSDSDDGHIKPEIPEDDIKTIQIMNILIV